MYNSQSTYESLVDVCVNSAMANIRSMTTDQLNDLLYNESRFNGLVDSLPQIRSLPTEREAGLAQNKSLAEWNLAQEPKLTQLRKQVKDLYGQATSLRTETEALKSKLDEISSSKSLDTTSNLLQVAAQEADDDAEGTAKAFLAGTISIEQFLKDLLEKKALAHLR
ncbi:modifier of rudimentary (Mod(r)) protein [Necator americanus]|nr:modifier of rudimentary (Mod(r)) protein [Necator americanus]ETN83683.1 modifier of rudimentary (Mod(r)) protein [Necator americanus]